MTDTTDQHDKLYKQKKDRKRGIKLWSKLPISFFTGVCSSCPLAFLGSPMSCWNGITAVVVNDEKSDDAGTNEVVAEEIAWCSCRSLPAVFLVSPSMFDLKLSEKLLSVLLADTPGKLTWSSELSLNAHFEPVPGTSSLPELWIGSADEWWFGNKFFTTDSLFVFE